MYVRHMYTVLCSRGLKGALDSQQLELRCIGDAGKPAYGCWYPTRVFYNRNKCS